MMAKAILVFLASIPVGALCPSQPAYAGTPTYGASAITRCAFGSVTEQTAATDIAAQVRLQGHRCEGSVNAQRRTSSGYDSRLRVPNTQFDICGGVFGVKSGYRPNLEFEHAIRPAPAFLPSA